MSVLEKVRGLIERLAPHAVCEDCITDRLKLSVRQHVNDKRRELAAEPRFERGVDVCSLCRSHKKVIRYTGPGLS